jgi:hypothetical protein
MNNRIMIKRRLRQLTPSVGELSAEETFYAAGWDAARKAKKPQRRRHEIRGFAMGMVCSLAYFAVGMQMWPAAEFSERPQIAESNSPQPDVSKDIAAVSSESGDEVVTPPKIGGLDEVFAILSPASWFAVEDYPPRQRSSVLTRAGSNGIDVKSLWNMASVERTQAKSSPAASPGSQGAKSPESLRAFPVSPDVFDEWL